MSGRLTQVASYHNVCRSSLHAQLFNCLQLWNIWIQFITFGITVHVCAAFQVRVVLTAWKKKAQCCVFFYHQQEYLEILGAPPQHYEAPVIQAHRLVSDPLATTGYDIPTKAVALAGCSQSMLKTSHEKHLK